MAMSNFEELGIETVKLETRKSRSILWFQRGAGQKKFYFRNAKAKRLCQFVVRTWGFIHSVVPPPPSSFKILKTKDRAPEIAPKILNSWDLGTKS
jgi:hypothetical protein